MTTNSTIYKENKVKDKLLHTPEGVRDIYGEEFMRKEMAEQAIIREMKKYGFLQINAPSFEYFDIFNYERGTVPSKDMFRFIDRDGETLVLRPDMTPQIARCIAKYHKSEKLPVRLFYHGNTFVNNSSYQGKLREITQIGAELVNIGSAAADAEMIALMIDCIKSIGIGEFQIEVGNAGFFRSLTDEAGFTEDETDELRTLIEAKNLCGVEELLSDKNISENLKELFLQLPLQFGSSDFIKDLMEHTENEGAVEALKRLNQIFEILKEYGKESYVSFDLGMLSQYDYYTGVVFKAYTHKTGEPIAAGGRYDKLLAQFGKPAQAIGIAIYTDNALSAMNRQGIAKDIDRNSTLILYKDEYEEKAIGIANSFRQDGLKAILLKEDENVPASDYDRYANSVFAGGIIYVNEAGSVSFKDLKSGKITKKEL